MSNELFLKRCVSSSFLSLFLSLCLAIVLFLFCLYGFFLMLSFMQILALVVLYFHHFEGSFHFWELLWGLVLRPLSSCSSLMLYSPFSHFLWLLSLLVASFFLFSLGHHMAPFSLSVRLTGLFVFVFCFLMGCLPPSSFLSVLTSLLSLDPFTV